MDARRTNGRGGAATRGFARVAGAALVVGWGGLAGGGVVGFGVVGCGGDPEPLPPLVLPPEGCEEVARFAPVAPEYEGAPTSTGTPLQVHARPHGRGWVVAWLEYPDQLTANARMVLAYAEVDEGGRAGEVRRVELGIFSGDTYALQAVDVLGDRVLVVLRDTFHLVDIDDPASLESFGGPSLDAIGTTPLDDDRLAIVGVEAGGTLTYRVFDVSAQAFSPPVELSGAAPVAGAAPGIAGLFGQTLGLERVGAGRLLVTWASSYSQLSGAILDDGGSFVAFPTTIIDNDGRGVYVPDVTVLDDATPGGRMAAAWTGQSGTEVRARALPLDLQGVVVTAGDRINQSTDGSQDFAHVVPLGGADALAVWSTQGGGISAQTLTFDAEDRPQTGGIDFDPVDGCSRVAAGDMSVAEGEGGALLAWIETGWARGDRVLVRVLGAN